VPSQSLTTLASRRGDTLVATSVCKNKAATAGQWESTVMFGDLNYEQLKRRGEGSFVVQGIHAWLAATRQAKARASVIL
jgi:hypothetical protein